MANTGTETKRFFRYPDRGPLGGVCAGIADYAGVDANLVRLGAIVLAVMGPGIPAYILAWIFLPAEDGTVVAPRVGQRGSRWSEILGIGLIIIAISVLWGDWWFPGRGWVLPVGLIAFGAWLLFRDDDEEDDVPTPPAPPAPLIDPTATSVAPAPPAPPTGATEAGSDSDVDARDVDATDHDTLVGPPSDGGDGPPTDQLPPIQPPPAPKARRRRVLGPLVFGALLLWGGIAWITGVDIEDGLAIGLCILGAGFVLGAFIGGSKALVVPALLIALSLVCVSVIDIPLHGGVGDRRWAPASLSELEDRYELAIGEATLDLSQLTASAGRVPEVELDLGIGHLEVIVPEDATVDVRAEAGAGELRVLGYEDDGMGVELERTIRGDADGDRFELDLHVGLGEVEVRRASEPPSQVEPIVPPKPTIPARL